MDADASQATGGRHRRALARWAVAVPLLIVLGVLAFGPAHWHKAIYMFQAYVWPGHANGVIAPPDGFTGTWRTYYHDGKLRAEKSCTDGGRDGRYGVGWHPGGGKWFEIETAPSGNIVCTYWHQNGRKVRWTEWAACSWLSGERHWAQRCQVARDRVWRLDGSSTEFVYEPDPAHESGRWGRTVRETHWHLGGGKKSEFLFDPNDPRRFEGTRWDEAGEVVARWRKGVGFVVRSPPGADRADGNSPGR